MMTPVFLNPPSSSFTLVELKEDQHLQIFLSPTHQAASTSTPPSSLHTSQDPRGNILFGEPKQHDHKRAQSYGRLSGQKTTLSSSSFHPVNDKTNDVHKFSPIKTPEDKEYEGSCGDGLAKWMPSKMRLMHKMMNSSSSSSTTTDDKPMKFTLKFQDQRYHHHVNESSSSSSNNNNNSNTAAIRVCSDCNTTTTPLWRSGPRGPKSLCNACGIRQRKARRAAAAAAENGIVMNMETSPSTSKINKVHANKEKKSRISHIGQSKKLCKPPDSPTRQSQKKLCFKNLALSLSKNSAFQGVFSQDVEEAAILLMELSCGLVHS